MLACDFSKYEKIDNKEVWVCAITFPDKKFTGNFSSNKKPHVAYATNKLNEYLYNAKGIKEYRMSSIVEPCGTSTYEYSHIFLTEEECNKHYAKIAKEAIEKVRFAKIAVDTKFANVEKRLNKIINKY